MRNYLSIDLDYWMEFDKEGIMYGYRYESYGLKKMIAFLNKAIALKVPIHIVDYHDEMAKYVNRFNVDQVINVDTHSDLVDRSYFYGCSRTIDEACWSSFVHHRGEKRFLWYHPDPECYCSTSGYSGRGRCDRDENPFEGNSKEICGWGKCNHRTGLPTKQQMDNVVAVGICISPNWSDEFHTQGILPFLRERGLVSDRFVKNVLHEIETCQFKYSGA